MPPANRDLLCLTPIAPASTGNGLAMRSWLFIKAASLDFSVKVAVVPAAGHSRTPPAVPAVVVDLPDARQIVAAVPGLLARPAWRARLSRASPLPPAARVAPATMAAAVVAAARAAPGTPVHVMRSYLLPLGVAVAEQIRSPWATADLDDDDQQLADDAGLPDEALGYERLVGVFGPLFARLAVAGAGDANAIGARHGLAPVVIPNAVHAALRPAGSRRAGSRRAGTRDAGTRRETASLLFVGNLTYWPNVDAAIRLVRDVLPRIREASAGAVRLTLAGDACAAVRELACDPGVRVTGFVPDLARCYADADVVVAPLAHGAGTRIKLLEAFAAGVPVVTTGPGAAGLEVADGEHALLADTPAGLAAAVARLLADPALQARLVRAATGLVTSRYSHAVVIPQIRQFFAAAASGTPASGAATQQPPTAAVALGHQR